MTNRIYRAFEPVKASKELQAATLEYLQIESEKRSRPHSTAVWKRSLAVACAALVLLLGTGGYQAVQTPVSYVSIDVNPSVEFALNRFDRVVDAEAFNDDGEIVLDGLHLKGMPCAKAIDLLVESDAMQPYLTQDAALTFTVAAQDSETEAALMLEIEGSAGCRRYGGTGYCADVDTLSEAHESGLSLGKYHAYQILSQYDNTVTPEDCKDMTMAEIHRQIHAHTGGGQSGLNEQSSQSGEHGGQNGPNGQSSQRGEHNGQNGHGGHGHGASHSQ